MQSLPEVPLVAFDRVNVPHFCKGLATILPSVKVIADISFRMPLAVDGSGSWNLPNRRLS
jgi:hypothetical protein